MTSTRFKNAFEALTTAYFEGTLVAGNCAACAVGNIVAHGMDLKLTREEIFDVACRPANSFWDRLFCTVEAGIQETFFGVFTNLEKRFSDLTGYSPREAAQIEYAFERNTKIKYLKYPLYSEQEVLEDQYNGLHAVIEVLCRLDGIEAVSEHQQAFRKHPKLIPA